MRKIDPIRLTRESMKAPRFLSEFLVAVRQGLVGAFVVGSLFWVIQPAQAHGDAKADGAMPDTRGATGSQGDPTSPQRDSELMTM